MSHTLYEIIKEGRNLESKEMARKLALAVNTLNVTPEYVVSTGDHFLDLVAGAIELGLAPHLIYESFYCPGTDTEIPHIIETALVFEDRKLCPRHTLNEVRTPTLHEAIVHVRNLFD